MGGWLRSLGMAQYTAAFSDGSVDGAQLLELTEDRMEHELGVGEYMMEHELEVGEYRMEHELGVGEYRMEHELGVGEYRMEHELRVGEIAPLGSDGRDWLR